MRFDDTLSRLVIAVLGADAGMEILDTMTIDPSLTGDGETVSRATMAMALNAVLMHGLLQRVPTGAAYVADRRKAGHRITFDHGALRTVRFLEGPTGALPAGERAFTRILEPLGYRISGLYPLARLRMTGRAYTHADQPETIPQFFVSELHAGEFSPAFHDASVRVFGASGDPLTAEAKTLLERLALQGQAPLWLAVDGLPAIGSLRSAGSMMCRPRRIIACCWRNRPRQPGLPPRVTPSTMSPTASATSRRWPCRTEGPGPADEGQGRNLDQRPRPADRLQGRSGRRAACALRNRRDRRSSVPGSFYEFISRDGFIAANGRRVLDLTFDSGNAQGIFKMTAAGGR